MKASINAVAKVQEITEKNPGMVFRVAIQGAGCAGFQYVFGVTEPEDDDIVVSEGIVTDQLSMMYLEEAELDFKVNTFSQVFVVNNPNAKTTCGCGESFSV